MKSSCTEGRTERADSVNQFVPRIACAPKSQDSEVRRCVGVKRNGVAGVIAKKKWAQNHGATQADNRAEVHDKIRRRSKKQHAMTAENGTLLMILLETTLNVPGARRFHRLPAGPKSSWRIESRRRPHCEIKCNAVPSSRLDSSSKKSPLARDENPKPRLQLQSSF